METQSDNDRHKHEEEKSLKRKEHFIQFAQWKPRIVVFV